MERKRYVTARIVSNNSHIIIDANDSMNALRIAGQLHRLGEDKCYQIRLRSTRPNLKTYKYISNIMDIIS